MTESTLPHQTDPLKIVLVEPKIPPNVGAIGRICACIGSPLYIVGPVTFSEDHPKRRRAGLDYWDKVKKIYLDSFDDFLAMHPGVRFHLFTKKTQRSLFMVRFQPGDALVFGSETSGLPPEITERYQEHAVRIPMVEGVRSLNLANSVGIAAYEAIRQVVYGGHPVS